MNRQYTALITATLVSMTTAAIGLVGCGKDAPVVAEPEAPAVEREVEDEVFEFKGVVTTRESKVIAAEFEGRVVAIYVQDGQRVTKGTPIAKLDDSELQSKLAGAVASADAARAEKGRAGVEIRAAKRQMRMQRRLYRSGASAREQTRSAGFERSRAGASYGSAAAQHRQALSEKRMLQAKIKKATLVAPIDGIVSMIRLKEGEMARTGMAVARVFDPSDLTVRFALEQKHRDLVVKGTRVSSVIPSTGAEFEVVVENVSAALEPPLQFLVAKADIDDRGINLADVGVGAIGQLRIVRKRQ